MANWNGFTLIELMVTIAIAAILLTVGVPSFVSTVQNNRMVASLNDLVTDLNLARSEAVTRGVRVTACRSSDGQTCNTGNGDWSQGWIVFSDPNNSGAFENGVADETLLRVHGTLADDENTTLVGNLFVRNYISYGAAGFTQLRNSNAFQAGKLVLCDSRGYEDHARILVINNTGRLNSLTTRDLSDAEQTDCNAG